MVLSTWKACQRCFLQRLELQQYIYAGKIVATLLLFNLLNACAMPSHTTSHISVLGNPTIQLSQPKATHTGPGLSEDELKNSAVAWWYVSFIRDWREDTQWYIDAYIAHQIIKPLLDDYGQDIKLWRFHRRSVDDATGHRFSFYFYATQQLSQKIYQTINEDPKVQSLLDNHAIKKLSYTDLRNNEKTEIEDASDGNWTHEIQRAWPNFAMGASQTWLTLIDDLVTTVDESATMTLPLDDQLSRFKRVHDEIDRMWQDQGAHAFLHHLNALFGYTELFVYERKLRRF